MAYFTRKLPSEKAETITLGDGVNTFDTVYTISKSQAVDSRNVSSRHYPALSTRGGVVSSFSALTTPNGATARNGADLHVVDGTTWKRWSSGSFTNVATGLTNALANFVEFKQATTNYTIMFNGTDKKAYNGSTVTDITQAVATRLICVDDNRLYTLKNAEVKCSALYDPFDFTTVFDSHNIRISAMEGTETALVGYEGTKIAFSDKTMHIIMGDDFRNFQVMDPIKAGCVSQRSIAECNGILYFMDYGKYKIFSGGFPSDVSQKVKKYLENINYAVKEKIVAGVQGKYIYLSIPYGGSATANNMTLEYDTELNNWYPMSTGYVNFVNIGEDLYGVKADGNIEKMNSGNNALEWYHETGVLSPTPIRPNKTLSDMWLEIELPSGSTMKVQYNVSVEGGTWTDLYNFVTNSSAQKARVKVPSNVLANQQRYRLRFAGTGTAKIHFLETYERVKGR
jgi:hypothetical protein